MADETAKDLANLSPEERLRRQALADKRNEALDTVSSAIRRQNEARRGIVDKMR